MRLGLSEREGRRASPSSLNPKPLAPSVPSGGSRRGEASPSIPDPVVHASNMLPAAPTADLRSGGAVASPSTCLSLPIRAASPSPPLCPAVPFFCCRWSLTLLRAAALTSVRPPATCTDWLPASLTNRLPASLTDCSPVSLTDGLLASLTFLTLSWVRNGVGACVMPLSHVSSADSPRKVV